MLKQIKYGRAIKKKPKLLRKGQKLSISYESRIKEIMYFRHPSARCSSCAPRSGYLPEDSSRQRSASWACWSASKQRQSFSAQGNPKVPHVRHLTHQQRSLSLHASSAPLIKRANSSTYSRCRFTIKYPAYIHQPSYFFPP